MLPCIRSKRTPAEYKADTSIALGELAPDLYLHGIADTSNRARKDRLQIIGWNEK